VPNDINPASQHNDLPMVIGDISVPIFFTDYTSVLISSKNRDELDLKLNMVLHIINNWFASYLLPINFQKNQCMQFTTKHATTIGNKVQVNSNKIIEIPHIKLLGLEIDKTLTWNLHIDKIINKLTSVCFMLRTFKPYMSPSSLKMLYYSLFHSVLTYVILFWGKSSNSQRFFILQKRAIRIITGQGNRISCRPFFKQSEILLLKSQYIYSILLLVITHKEYFMSDLTRYNIQTKQCDNFYLPTSSLTVFQHGVHYAGVTIFNNLPLEIK
jgi:hypothetical protein